MPAVRRTRLLAAAALLVTAWILVPVPARQAVAASCSAWTTSYAPPPTIRVLRVATGAVETVPFLTYVDDVMPSEWPSTYPTEALRVGAVAVKQYAWYRAMAPRTTAAGDCYDVRDDNWDQIYDPSRTPAANQLAAVADTWSLTLRKSGSFFLVHYDAGTSTTCGAEISASTTWLYQQGVRACALAGRTMAQILHVYLDPGLTIADATRRFGADRYATAAAISAAHFAPGAPVVFVATGLDFPDALAAGPAAAKLGGPVLLVAQDALPDPTAAELARLAPKRIVVLGGEGAVSANVLTALAAFSPDVSRVSGADRYATAVATSQAAFGPGVPVAFIATGLDFPDALSGSAAGAKLGGPVLLVPRGTVPDVVAAELKRLTPASIRVLGGPLVVSDTVLEALRAYSPDVSRLAGADRYATAAAVSAATYAPGVASLELATGLNFPDALAGAPLGGPLLLVPGGGSLPSSVATEVLRLKPAHLEPLGGTGPVPDAAVTNVVTTLATAP